MHSTTFTQVTYKWIKALLMTIKLVLLLLANQLWRSVLESNSCGICENLKIIISNSQFLLYKKVSCMIKLSQMKSLYYSLRVLADGVILFVWCKIIMLIVLECCNALAVRWAGELSVSGFRVHLNNSFTRIRRRLLLKIRKIGFIHGKNKTTICTMK